jgi:hypothetical protein
MEATEVFDEDCDSESSALSIKLFSGLSIDAVIPAELAIFEDDVSAVLTGASAEFEVATAPLFSPAPSPHPETRLANSIALPI